MGESSRRALIVGSYTEDSGGRGTGITRHPLDYDGYPMHPDAHLALDSPSFLAAHPTLPVLYAALESRGALRAVTVDDDGLHRLGDAIVVGDAPCHISIDQTGTIAAVSCYGSGVVALVTLGTDGSPGETIELPPADAAAPDVSRAHATHWLPDDRLVATDLGCDLVRVWCRRAGEWMLQQELAMPTGSGPRHIARRRDGDLLVVGEYSCAVSVLSFAPDGSLSAGPPVPVLSEPKEGDAAAEVCVAHDATVALVGVRGSDAIAVLDVRGHPEGIGQLRLDGSWPRHHTVIDDMVHVACERSHAILSFRLGDVVGDVPRTRRLDVGSPTSALSWTRHP